MITLITECYELPFLTTTNTDFYNYVVNSRDRLRKKYMMIVAVRLSERLAPSL